MNAEVLQRQFEVFIDLPASYSTSGSRAYPLVLMLDANYSYALGRQTITLMHQNGEADEAIIVGLGVPRGEGNIAFALRRLEEFSPPVGDYQCDDSLGRILGSVFALHGRDIVQHFGRAEGLYDFIVTQLLPLLQSSLRIERSRQVLFGHSAGGTFAAYTLMQADCPFSGVICSSPGLAITDNWLMKSANHTLDTTAQRHLVLGVGSLEFDNAFNRAAGIPDTPKFAAQLRGRGALQCSLIEPESETHSSVFVRTLARGLALTLGRDGSSIAESPPV